MKSISDEIESKWLQVVRDQIWDQVRIYGQVSWQLRWQVYDQVSWQVCNRVWRQVQSEVNK